MRIRKNAKVSPLIYAVATLQEGIIFKPHVCQLNQSPWDVLDFSPPPSQVNRSGGSAANGSSGGCVPAADRKPQPSEFPGTMPPPPPPQIVHKKDGETSQFQSRSKQHNSNKKSAGEVAAPPRPTRPKKAPSTGPNDFYYYSGFGPRWGKERGESSRNNRHEKEIEAMEIEIEESDNVEYMEEEEEEVVVGKKRGRKPIKARSLKSLM